MRKFATLPFEEIIKRLLKSRHDLTCFKALADLYFRKQDATLRIREYEKSNKESKVKQLVALSERCTNLPKYEDYSYQDVMLSTIAAVAPSKWFKNIFGHTDKENELYPSSKRFLKREFENYTIHETYHRRSRVGIRWSDFTLVRKGLTGYELLSLDVKVRLGAFDYFFNQAHDFSYFSDRTFLICTAGLILEASTKVGKRPTETEELFVNKLRKLGIGVYIVDTTSGVFEQLADADKSDSLDKILKNRALHELLG